MIMEERINVAELLKDCPKGMELDCVLYNDITLHEVVLDRAFPIVLKRTNGDIFVTTKYGQYQNTEDAKCVIFPKGKTTWKGFVPPCKFKDGDIVINASNQYSNAFIYAGESNYYYYSYVGLTTGDFPELLTDKSLAWVSKSSRIRFATEKEKEKLFKAIKDNGYKWNTDTKTLEKLIEPKFKVGDRIVCKNGITKPFTISKVGYNCYYVNDKNAVGIISLSEQDNYELVPNKFDINTLKPFDKVLVRDEGLLEDSEITDATWSAALYSHNKFCDNAYPYFTTNGNFAQCVPYKGNEHLLGTTDDCDEYYKTWE